MEMMRIEPIRFHAYVKERLLIFEQFENVDQSL